MNSITDHLRGMNYSGFVFADMIRAHDSDSYMFRFINKDENKYFQLCLTHQSILNMRPHQIIDYIDTVLKNHPDLRKASHHQEFYKKFDEVLK